MDTVSFELYDLPNTKTSILSNVEVWPADDRVTILHSVHLQNIYKTQ